MRERMSNNMPTKTAQKTNAKVAVASKEVDKEKLAAQRAKLIESLVADISEKIVEQQEAKKTEQNLFLEIADKLKESVEANELTKDESKKLILLSIADANNIPVEDINHKNPKAITFYTYASKIQSLVFPKDKAAAKEVEKAREKGVSVEGLLKVARGKVTAAQVNKSKGRGGDTSESKKVNGKAVIDDIDTFGNELAALIARAVKGDLELDDIQDKFATVFAEVQETLADDDEADDKD